ncbi:MAG: DUF4328 domain-containing protein [Proteobacteria bacterium]|nr:DUF4328 domain-containing protein [Pseudomonadota bacterium]
MSRIAYLKKRDRLSWWLVRISWLVVVLFVIDLALVAASTGLRLLILDVVGSVQAGRELSAGAVEFISQAATWLGIVGLVVGPCLVILFCGWVCQAYRLYKWRGDARYDHSPFWAVAYFFVPFANWWMPPLVVSEMWRGTDPKQTDPKQARQGLVVWWWLVYVPLPLVATYVHNRAGATQTLPQVASFLWTLIVVDLWHVVAAVLALVLVRRLTRRMVYFGPRTRPWPSVDEVVADLERAYRLPKTVLPVNAFGGRRKYGG